MRTLTLLALVLAPLALAGPATQPVTPLTNVHAHNDYAHAHPLLDALDCGIGSVEADVHLIDGELRVAHDPKMTVPGRTLQSLYLDPLRARVNANGGRVFRDGPTVVLLIDVKTSFSQTYPALRNVLTDYAELLTTWTDGKRTDGAVTVIITGDRKQTVIAADNPRLCACDGGVEDFETNPPAELVPWVSENWPKHFKWKAKPGEPMPDAERAALRDLAARAHAQGRKLRFWGGPDNPAIWAEQLADGVEMLNTDKLKECRTFLLEHR